MCLQGCWILSVCTFINPKVSLTGSLKNQDYLTFGEGSAILRVNMNMHACVCIYVQVIQLVIQQQQQQKSSSWFSAEVCNPFYQLESSGEFWKPPGICIS